MRAAASLPTIWWLPTFDPGRRSADDAVASAGSTEKPVAKVEAIRRISSTAVATRASAQRGSMSATTINSYMNYAFYALAVISVIGITVAIMVSM